MKRALAAAAAGPLAGLTPTPLAPEQVTVAIEGWNAGDLGSRAAFRETLQSLRAQTFPFARCEVLVLIDLSAPSEEESWLRSELPGARVLREAKATYYRLKNRAIAEAHGEVLLFADSDVRYSVIWMESMLVGLRPGVDIVVGDTSYEPGFWSRTQSLCDWNATQPRSGPTRAIYGNNLAMRRSLYQRIHFREDLGSAGGGAADLIAEQLLSEGSVLWFSLESKGWHHLGDFVTKRLRNGAYLVHHRKLATFKRLPWLSRIPVVGGPLVVAGTMIRAWGRAWRLRGALPVRGFSVPAYWVSIAVAKSLEGVGAALYEWVPASFLRRWDWYTVLAVEPVPPPVSGNSS